MRLPTKSKIKKASDDKANYIRVSDLVPMADKIGYDRRQIVALLCSMYEIADFNRCFKQLTNIGKLEYVFDLCQLLQVSLKSDDFICLLIEGYKEAVNSL